MKTYTLIFDKKKLVVLSRDRAGKDLRYIMNNKQANKKLGW
tara:strand:+ start:3192 stop:3314 length:123 start_codon:yes stop_codon:yes gene_type:complete